MDYGLKCRKVRMNYKEDKKWSEKERKVPEN